MYPAVESLELCHAVLGQEPEAHVAGLALDHGGGDPEADLVVLDGQGEVAVAVVAEFFGAPVATEAGARVGTKNAAPVQRGGRSDLPLAIETEAIGTEEGTEKRKRSQRKTKIETATEDLETVTLMERITKEKKMGNLKNIW